MLWGHCSTTSYPRPWNFQWAGGQQYVAWSYIHPPKWCNQKDPKSKYTHVYTHMWQYRIWKMFFVFFWIKTWSPNIPKLWLIEGTADLGQDLGLHPKWNRLQRFVRHISQKGQPSHPHDFNLYVSVQAFVLCVILTFYATNLPMLSEDWDQGQAACGSSRSKKADKWIGITQYHIYIEGLNMVEVVVDICWTHIFYAAFVYMARKTS